MVDINPKSLAKKGRAAASEWRKAEKVEVREL